jgi:Phasin protein
VYREAAERAAGDVHALFDSCTSLGRGLQHWQHAYFDYLQQWLESVARKRKDLVQTNSPVQFAEVQRDLYVDLVNHTLKASTALLQLAGQIAQDAVRPLHDRSHSGA